MKHISFNGASVVITLSGVACILRDNKEKKRGDPDITSHYTSVLLCLLNAPMVECRIVLWQERVGAY